MIKSFEQTDGGVPTRVEGPLKPDEVFDAELATEMCKRTDKLNDASIDLAIRLKQARSFIEWSAHHLKKSWLDWQDEATTASKDVTMLRMCLDRETKTATAAAKDIRDFFNSPEYEKAHSKMKEMLDMMERFEQLKKDGVMDAFAEFILKVTCK